MSYQLFTDATADFCTKMFEGLPQIGIVPMEVMVDDTPYRYGPSGNLSIDEFCLLQQEGKFSSTSQISPETYRAAFEPVLQKGQDILYLGFSSGMSGTMNSAFLCAQKLMNLYPDRTIRCIDTLCASVGEGLIVREAAVKQSNGMEFKELAKWVEEHRLQVCHWFTVGSFQHLLHGGRVSSTAAIVGSVLNIKPLLHVDNEGKLKVMGKPRGQKQALQAKMERLKQGWLPELSNVIFIGHEDAIEQGEILYNEIEKQFPDAKIFLADIGPVIGAHTGPETLAVTYCGNNR